MWQIGPTFAAIPYALLQHPMPMPSFQLRIKNLHLWCLALLTYFRMGISPYFEASLCCDRCWALSGVPDLLTFLPSSESFSLSLSFFLSLSLCFSFFRFFFLGASSSGSATSSSADAQRLLTTKKWASHMHIDNVYYLHIAFHSQCQHVNLWLALLTLSWRCATGPSILQDIFSPEDKVEKTVQPLKLSPTRRVFLNTEMHCL